MNTKAVRIHGKMDLRLEDISLPEVGPDDVQVKIISDSVCMSTYKAAVEGAEHKRVPDDVAEHPTIVGHEFCGEIPLSSNPFTSSTIPFFKRACKRSVIRLRLTSRSTSTPTING